MKLMFRKLLIAIIFSILLFGCGNSNNNSVGGGDDGVITPPLPPIPPSTLTLNQSKIMALKNNNTFKIEAFIDGILISASEFDFQSNNPSASVDADGKVTINANDNATVTVKSKKYSTLTASLIIEPYTFKEYAVFSYDNAFAIDYEGKFYAWGRNDSGQLGVGDFEKKSEPTLVKLPEGRSLTSLDNLMADGYSTFAILDDGLLYAWGWNIFGQLGLGNEINQNKPTPIDLENKKLLSMDNFKIINSSSFAMLEGGELYAWGYNAYGQIGIGNDTNISTPTKALLSNKPLTSFWTNGKSSFAFLDGNELYAWGYNIQGQLGVGSNTNALTPSPVIVAGKTFSSPDNFTTDGNSTFAILNDNKVYAWGINDYGQLGIGNNTNQNKPTELPLLHNPISLANFQTINSSSFAFIDGLLYAWGKNNYGQLGVGEGVSNTLSPIIVDVGELSLNAWDNFATNGESSFAILSDGSFYGWGLNDCGQLGLGNTDNKGKPSPVNFDGKKLISLDKFQTRQSSSFALLDDGNFYAWGNNKLGQLGINSFDNPPTPTFVAPIGKKLSTLATLKTDGYTAFTLSDGLLYAWGYNEFGQLGTGDFENKPTPQSVW